MAEPLNTHTVKHFLDFISDGSGRVQIDEPIGFDAANFVVEQDSKRYGRDISFAGEQIDFTFISLVNMLGHRFDRLVENYTASGFETEINYIIQENGDDFVIGQLDYQTATTDQEFTFSCKIIQSTTQAIIKRRNDVKVDLFSDKDLDSEDITPVGTQNILLKAKPVTQSSEWKSSNIEAIGAATYQSIFGNEITTISGCNNIQDIFLGGIKDTLTYFESVRALNSNGFPVSGLSFTYLEALNDITSLTIDVTDFDCSVVFGISDFSNSIQSLTGYSRLVIRFGEDTEIGDDLNEIILDSFEFDLNTPQTVYNFDSEYSAEINLTRDSRVWIYIENFIEVDALNPNTVVANIVCTMVGGQINMTGVSTSIDSVTKGVRLVDAIKQTASSINQDFTTTLPRFDFGGEWYDNFVFSGNMIRGLDKPFVMSWKDIFQGIPELNSDYEIDENNVFVGKYDDFYTNIDIGAFLITPDATFEISFNERYSINEFNFKYKTFNQDQFDDNTNDAVHTVTEWLLQNKLVENKKDIDNGFIRDPLMLETTRTKSSSAKPTTSLSQDDKVFILDVVPLSPSARGGFTAAVTHFVDSDGNLQLLNDNTYSWTTLGFNVSDTFIILNTTNADSYTVIELTQSIITLNPNTITPTTLGLTLTGFEYAFTNVAFTNRTNEGFDLIENIDAPDKYSNLLYTPKRNIINNWGSYLKCATRYKPLDMNNQYFKNGGALTTQFDGGEILTENEPITQSQLPEALLTPEIITTKVLADFSMFKELEAKIKTDRGFIRIHDNQQRVRKIYIQKLDYSWSDNVMDIVGEVKFESQFLRIDTADGLILINEVGYSEDIVLPLEYIADAERIQFFDIKTVPLTNKIKFEFVKVNGMTFNSMVELTGAINLL